MFGFDVEIPHNLHLKAKLVDGKTIFEESFNDLAIRRLDEEDGTMSVFIDMACEKTVPNVKTDLYDLKCCNMCFWLPSKLCTEV